MPDDTVVTEALKTCPFCGDSATIDRDLNYVAVLCTNCNARSARFVDDTLGNDAEAIAAWNTRAALNAIRGDRG
jgi:Lar family restriction alleviation protein